MLTISLRKFKIFKSDAAPFSFFIDVFPPVTSYMNKEHFIVLMKNVEANPIMPLPMRIDRVYNGENSIIIQPRKPIFAQITNEVTAFINPIAFMQLGIQKLLYFTEIHGREKFAISISPENVKRWWNTSRFLYGNLLMLEEDFSNFLRTYLETLVKAKINEIDLLQAAKDYCQSILDICKKRIDENSIMVEINATKSNENIYIKKDTILRKKFKKYEETQVHPELIDVEVFDLSQINFNLEEKNKDNLLNTLKPRIMKYIPLLIYDDLYDCMFDNLARLEDKESQILDPTFLLENKVIILEQTKALDKIDLKSYSWWRNYNEIELDSILESIEITLKEFFLKEYGEFYPKVDKWKDRLDS